MRKISAKPKVKVVKDPKSYNHIIIRLRNTTFFKLYNRIIIRLYNYYLNPNPIEFRLNLFEDNYSNAS